LDHVISEPLSNVNSLNLVLNLDDKLDPILLETFFEAIHIYENLPMMIYNKEYSGFYLISK
jgi:hypothetical protein